MYGDSLQHTVIGMHAAAVAALLKSCVQGKRIGVISSIANNPNNDAEINAKFAQAVADLRAGGKLRFCSLNHSSLLCFFSSILDVVICAVCRQLRMSTDCCQVAGHCLVADVRAGSVHSGLLSSLSQSVFPLMHAQHLSG